MMMIIAVRVIAKKGREVAVTMLAIANALAIAITRPVGLDEQMPDAASGEKKKRYYRGNCLPGGGGGGGKKYGLKCCHCLV